MAKHLNSTDKEPLPGNVGLRNLLLQEPASWVQALIMALPSLAYLSVYYMEYYKYNRFGISTELITVRLEDILLVLLLTVSFVWSFVIDWGAEIANARNWKHQALYFLRFALLLSFACQAIMLISLSLKCGVSQTWQYVLLALQFAFTALLLLVPNKKHVSDRDYWAKAGTYFFSALIAYCVLSLGQASYLVFNLSRYQTCPENKTLIVGYDSQGRAISKPVLDVTESGICCVGEGYTLEEVTGKELDVKKYTYLQISQNGADSEESK